MDPGELLTHIEAVQPFAVEKFWMYWFAPQEIGTTGQVFDDDGMENPLAFTATERATLAVPQESAAVMVSAEVVATVGVPERTQLCIKAPVLVDCTSSSKRPEGNPRTAKCIGDCGSSAYDMSVREYGVPSVPLGTELKENAGRTHAGAACETVVWTVAPFAPLPIDTM